ncbi:Arabinose 5-phosphate isomerase KpsF [Crateriforma conspicua]|nr:Arabinose 5-phosphate isomerase KpsF [Crateriforma conspicua]
MNAMPAPKPRPSGLDDASASAPVAPAADPRSIDPRLGDTIDVPPETPLERLRCLRDTVLAESEALRRTAQTLSADAVRAAELTADCRGSVIVTGIGKAGWIGQKIAATLASVGTPAHFLHPSEAVHGDLGRVRKDDLVWAFSNSGRSEEVLAIAAHLRQYSHGLVAITADADNPLAAAADLVVTIGKHREACHNGLAPTCSTTAMLAVGDAIALLSSRIRRFTPQDFARFHPGGALGRKLTVVDDIMRDVAHCRIAPHDVPVRQAMVVAGLHGRRSGAVMLVDPADQTLSGIFTDSDLARLLESRREGELDRPVSELMTRCPTTIRSGSQLRDAIAILSQRRISELPVVDTTGRPIGLIDITDVVSLEGSGATPSPSSVKLTAHV